MNHRVDNFEQITRQKGANWKLDLIHKVNEAVPKFTDVFDEDTFYLTAFLFISATFLLAFILSRFITLRPMD